MIVNASPIIQWFIYVISLKNTCIENRISIEVLNFYYVEIINIILIMDVYLP